MANTISVKLPNGENMVVTSRIQPFYDEADQLGFGNPLPVALKFICDRLDSKDREISDLKLSREELKHSKDREISDLKLSKEELKHSKEELKQLKDDYKKASEMAIDAKDKLIIKYETENSDLKLSITTAEAKVRAVTANRIVLEAAMLRYASGTSGVSLSSMTQRFVHFRENVVLDSKGHLSAKSNSYFDELKKFGMMMAQEDVEREFQGLMHNVSTAHHYLTGGSSSSSGVHIGGRLPTTVALAISMLHLQDMKLSEIDLIVTGDNGSDLCRLIAGTATPF